ncbi:MAG: Ser-Thr-rich GPI-anchored membrane family protein, partial [bacterium]
PTLPDGSYQLKIENDGKGSSEPAYSGYFDIINSPVSRPSPQPSLVISYPQTGYSLYNGLGKGDETATTSVIANIHWNEQNGDLPVSISLLGQDGQIVRTLAQNYPNTGSYIWMYDKTLPGGTYQIKMDIVFSGKGSSEPAYSGYFTISN